MDNSIISNLNSYLTFKLGSESFAINVGNVTKIQEMTAITKIPKAPEFIKGVINLSGNVIPVVDTRLKFGFEETSYTINTSILVVCTEIEKEEVNLGIIVDSVSKVVKIKATDIKPSPSIGSKYKTEFITGILNLKDEFIMVLDINKIFSTDDVIITDHSKVMSNEEI